MPRPIRPIRPLAAPEPPKPVKTPTDPKTIRQNRSIFLVMLAIPLVTVSSYVLYKRVYLGQSKRVQQGEYTPDGGIRIFDKEERLERDSQSLLTRIFGKEE